MPERMSDERLQRIIEVSRPQAKILAEPNGIDFIIRTQRELLDAILAERAAYDAKCAEVERLTALHAEAYGAAVKNADDLADALTDLATMRELAEIGVCPRCHDTELTCEGCPCDHPYHALREKLLDKK